MEPSIALPATVSHWLTQETERHINWQIIPADATPAEFRQSPILYIASDRPLVLSDPQRQKIKTYIDQGGCVLAVNEGLSRASPRASLRK